MHQGLPYIRESPNIKTMSKNTPVCNFGWKAPDFRLQSITNTTYSLTKVLSDVNCHAVLVMFICNHCPYVKAIIQKLVADCEELKKYGVECLAICSNDTIEYPEDSFENMIIFAKDNKINFPYLHDPQQIVAKTYSAVCTPDFFGFNGEGLLQYRGRLDASGKNTGSNLKRELFEAMKEIALTGKGPDEQHPSIGCSIKWKK